MPLMVYLDETGDHNMESISPDYPVFGLVLVVVDTDEYIQRLVPAFYRMKIDFFGHEGVVFHSYEIRKKRDEFTILKDPLISHDFMEKMNVLMAMDYTLIAAFIDKIRHKAQYGPYAGHPYHLSLVFALERLTPLLEEKGQKHVQIIAESRGVNEDNDFRQVFYRFVSQGNNYMTAERAKGIEFRLSFCPKSANLVGMQIADLAAYPIGRHVIDSTKPNRSFDLIKPKFFRGTGQVYGLKVFP